MQTFLLCLHDDDDDDDVLQSTYSLSRICTLQCESYACTPNSMCVLALDEVGRHDVSADVVLV
jgi:hypothetical protein